MLHTSIPCYSGVGAWLNLLVPDDTTVAIESAFFGAIGSATATSHPPLVIRERCFVWIR
jgi:hypothetical protein